MRTMSRALLVGLVAIAVMIAARVPLASANPPPTTVATLLDLAHWVVPVLDGVGVPSPAYRTTAADSGDHVLVRAAIASPSRASPAIVVARPVMLTTAAFPVRTTRIRRAALTALPDQSLRSRVPSVALFTHVQGPLGTMRL